MRIPIVPTPVVRPTGTLGVGADVVLLRRTGQQTVMASIGRLRQDASFSNWPGKRKPTHWIKLADLPLQSLSQRVTKKEST